MKLINFINLTKNKEEKFVQDVLLKLTFDSKFAQNLSDDVAFLFSKNKIIISTDSICEGIHFKEGTPAFKVAHKLLARNLSDIASKGAKPLAYMLSIFKPENITNDYLGNFADGLFCLAKQFKIPLIGGDIANTKSSFFSANITIYGEVISQIAKRSNAKIGDNIYVTGKLGRAFLGFSGNIKFLEFYETPNPKIKLMQNLFKKYKISSSIDISDGFIKDIQSLLIASEVGAVIEFNKLPIPSNIKFQKELLEFGDDYEIIFTSKEKIKHKDVTKIGKIIKEKRLYMQGIDSFSNFGYEHFI